MGKILKKKYPPSELRQNVGKLKYLNEGQFSSTLVKLSILQTKTQVQ